MLLLWILFPAAFGWQTFTPQETDFLSKVHQEVDTFHQALFQTDSVPLPSHHVNQEHFSASGEQGHSGHKTSGETFSKGANSEAEKTRHHDKESGRKGHSDKEKVEKKYEEESKKKGETHSEDGHGGEHVSAFGGERGEGYKDRLLHKKGNYEKGYRDRYHLDEVLKHDKFWSSHHSLDKYHKYGHHDSDYHKKHADHHKHNDQKSGVESGSEGKKGETSGGHSGSEHKGHKSGSGAESKYEHKEEYHKKHVRR